MISYETALEIKTKYQDELLAKENVVGVGIGKKKRTGQFCIKVYVKEKKPVNQLKACDIIPRQLEGVRTDVVQTGKIMAQCSAKSPEDAPHGSTLS